MKKALLCILLALCVAFSALACAEVMDSDEQPVDEYTQVVECGHFTVRIPSFFDELEPGSYATENCLITIQASDFHPKNEFDIYNETRENWNNDDRDYAVIKLKNEYVFVSAYLSDGYAWGLDREALYYEAEIRAMCETMLLTIEMSSPEENVLTEYLDGILDHIVPHEITSYKYDEYAHRLSYGSFEVLLPSQFSIWDVDLDEDLNDEMYRGLDLFGSSHAVCFIYQEDDEFCTPDYKEDFFEIPFDLLIETFEPLSSKDMTYSRIETDEYFGMRFLVVINNGSAGNAAMLYHGNEALTIVAACSNVEYGEAATFIADGILEHLTIRENPGE